MLQVSSKLSMLEIFLTVGPLTVVIGHVKEHLVGTGNRLDALRASKGGHMLKFTEVNGLIKNL